jgi:rRNA maturation endonuclease Nob1
VVRGQGGRIHVVVYRCELCEQSLARAMTEHSDGVCRSCGSPMRIDDVFADRRSFERPVELNRRAA